MSNNDPIGTILVNEGGFVNNANDKGGATNHGITIATYSKWLGRQATVEEVRNMPVEQAREIYEKQYLNDPRINTLPNPPQTFVLDMSVNHGPKNAIKIMQRVINLAGFGPVDVDGVLGPGTRQAAINAQQAMGNYFQNALVDERIKFYQQIVANNPSQSVFLNGWLNRANSFRLPVE